MLMYQEAALGTATFPKKDWDKYLPMNYASEAGEVAGKFAKHFRGDGPLDNEEIAKELGDGLWHIAVLAHYIGYDLDDIAALNLRKLKDRKARGVIAGNGDNR